MKGSKTSFQSKYKIFYCFNIITNSLRTPKKITKSVYSKTPTFISNHISKIVMFTARNLRKNSSNNT